MNALFPKIVSQYAKEQVQISILRERATSLKEENATMIQKEENLVDAKEQVGIFSISFSVTDKHADKRGLFYQTLQIG